jgi:hypothetical protein
MILISPRRFYHVKSGRVKHFYKLLQLDSGVSTHIERFSFEASAHLYHFRNTPKNARSWLRQCKILASAKICTLGATL